MTLDLAYAIVAAMAGLAIFALIATIHFKELTWNQNLAWHYRERLADLAFDAQDQEDIPPLVRDPIRFLADHAFDMVYMREVARAKPPQENAGLITKIRGTYPDNPEFGDMVAEALAMMTTIVLLSDPWSVHKSRHIEKILEGDAHNGDNRRDKRRREEAIPEFARIRQAIATRVVAEVPGL